MKRIVGLLFILVVGLAALAGPAAAAAPANDNFAGATVITGRSGSLAGTNLEATGETGEAVYSTPVESVWYSWTPSWSGQVVFDTCTYSFDTTLAAYRGSTFPLERLVQDDDACGRGSRVSFLAAAGETYSIQVDGYGSGMGTFTLSWLQDVAAPANDDLAMAGGLLAEGGTRTNNNFDATKEVDEADHAGDAGGASVWYTWTAPRDGAATVDVTAGFDTLAAVYTQGGTGHTGLALIGANDDRGAGVTSSLVEFTAIAGETYVIAVDGKAGAQGDFTLAWGLPPANDDLAAPMVVDPAGETLYATNRYATTEAGEPLHAGVAGGASVWFSWTAPYDGWTEINTGGSDVDTLLGIYEASAPGTAGLQVIESNDDAAAGATTSDVRYFANGGTTYLVAVDGKAGAEGDIRLSVGQAPAEDLLAQALAITGVSGTTPEWDPYWTTLATAEAGEPAHAGNTAAKSIWLTWQATDNGRASFSTTGTSFDTVIGVYTQSGTEMADLIEVTANDDVSATDTTSSVNFITSAGTTYYIALDGNAGASGPALVQWRSGPENDDRAFATVVQGETGTIAGTNVNATGQDGDPGVVDWYGGGRTVWYTWTAPTSGGAQFALSNWSSSYTPSIRAFAPNVDGTFTVAPDTEYTYGYYGYYQNRFRATAGTTYLVGVDVAYFQSSRFDLTWSRIPPPPNDDFTASTTWEGDTGSGSADNHWATKEAGEPDHAGAPGGASVWFDWTPSMSGTARISIDTYDADGVVAVYTGDAVAALTLVDANDDRVSGNTDPFLRFPATAGTTYRIAVDHKNGRLTSMNLNWTVVATPANDDLAGATELGVGGGSLTNQDTTGAMAEVAEPLHAGRVGGASLWYRFTAPEAGGTFEFTAAPACGDRCWWEDVFVAAYTGDGTDVATLTNVAANDDAPYVTNSRMLFVTTPGETYYVAVDTPNGDARVLNVGWGLAPTPTNDAFATPMALAGAAGLVDVTNTGATEEIGEPVLVGGRDGQQSVWFTWTAPSSGTALFETAGSSVSTLLGMFTGDDMGAVTRVGSSWYPDVAGAGTSRIHVPVTEGTTYRIGVDGDGRANGALTLQWNLNPPPANDDVSGATLLEEESGTIVGTNVGATKQAGEPNHGYVVGGASVWYRFVAPYSGAATFTTAGSDNNTALGIYTGTTVGQLSSIAQDNDGGGSDGSSRIRFQMTAGQTYQVAVDTVDGLVGELTLNYAFRAPDANDDFALPLVLENAAGSVPGSTIGATTQSGEPCCDGSSVWYTWTAPVNGEVRFTTTSPTAPGVNNAIRAFTGTAINGLSDVGYTEHGYYAASSVARFPVTQGTTYRVAVYSYYYYSQQYDFVLNYNIGPPDHDAFAAPRVLSGTQVSDTSVNLGATEETGEPDHAAQAGSSSVWFQWTAPADGSATIDLAGSTFDSLLGVYTGDALGALTQVAANDDAATGTTSSAVTFDAVSGTVYRIAVDGKATAQGGVRLSLVERVPELSIDDVRVDEAAGSATFTVTRGGALHLPTSVEYATYHSSAGADDYTTTASNGTPVAFAAGETTKTVTVPITADDLDESDEEVFGISLHSATGGVIVDGWGAGTIVDDDLPPTVTWTGGEVQEGDDGPAAITFTATLSAPSGRTVELVADTANGTAFAPSDYSARSGQPLSFAVGETVETFTVTVNGDTTDEEDQTFTAALASPTNVTIPEGTGMATGTILDDDLPPEITITDAATVTETSVGPINAAFTVSLSAASEKTVQGAYATADGTARADRGDYTARTGTLSFAPGELRKVLAVAVLDDIYDEFDQSFGLDLSTATNGTIIDGSALATVVDDDATPTMAIADAEVVEGGTAGLTVSTSAPSEKPIRVAYATGAALPVTEPATDDPAALGGADHTPASGTLDFAQDQQVSVIQVATGADSLHEYDETFGVALSMPEHVELADGQAIGTILNDDDAPSLTVNDATFAEGDTDAIDNNVAVALSAPSGRRIGVRYAVAGGTATPAGDFRSGAGDLTFAPGVQERALPFGIVGDTVDEYDQTAVVALSAPVDATLGRAEATLTISDDDLPAVATFTTAADQRVDEPAGPVSFTIGLDQRSEKPVTLAVNVVDDTTSPADHGAGPAQPLAFAPGTTALDVTIDIVDDTTDEPDQAFRLILGAGDDVRLGAAADTTRTVTILDEDLPPIASITDADRPVDEGVVDATATIRLSERSEKPVAVVTAVEDGTASAADHGSPAPAPVAFPVGTTEQVVGVPVVDDTTDEHDQTFRLHLTGGTDLRLHETPDLLDVVFTVVDDDEPPTVSLSGPTAVEESQGVAAYQLTLSALSEKDITATVALADLTTDGLDHGDVVPVSPVLIGAGQSGVAVIVDLVDDELDEPDEQVRLTLTAATNATMGSPTSVTTTVADDDATPVASAGAATAEEDTPVVIALEATDADSASLTYRVSTGPTGGTVALAGASVTYTPATDANGTDSFTFVASDGINTSAPATVTVTVTPVNDRPTAGASTLTVAEDTSGSIDLADLVGDVETAGADLTVTASAGRGTATVDGLTLRYQGDPHANGADTITVTVTDTGDPAGCGAAGPSCTAPLTSEPAAIAVTVVPVNDEPVATDTTIALDEDAVEVPVDLSALVADVETADGDLAYEIITGPSGGVLGGGVGAGARTYTPSANAFGTDTFSYRVTDTGDGDSPSASSAVRTVTLQIAAVNDLPVATDDAARTRHDESTVIDVLANDSDVEGLVPATVTVTAPPAHGAAVVDAATGAIRYTPTPRFDGTDSLTYQVCDTDGACAAATVALTVWPNTLPVAVGDEVATGEDTPTAAIDVLGNDDDADGDTLTVTGWSQGAFGSVECTSAGACTYTPAADRNGTDSFTYTVDDAHGGTATATVTVSVTPVQDAPVAGADSVTTAEDETTPAIDLLANDTDADGDTLTVDSSTNGTSGAVSCSVAACTYTPSPDFNGTDRFTYTVTDGYGGTVTSTVTVTVTPVDDQPAALDDLATAEEGGSVDVDVMANDTGLGDGGARITSVGAATYGTAVLIDGVVRYSPTADLHGTDTFTYAITDGDDDTASATITITVAPVNDAPVAADDTATTFQDRAAAIEVLSNDTDVDGDTLIVSGSTSPAHGTASCTSSVCTYTPAADWSGTDSFTYTATDGNGGTATGTVAVTVAEAAAGGTVAGGGTVATGGAPTPSEPLQVSVTSPVPGTISIIDRESATTQVEGYRLYGVEAVITAPAASAATPLRISLTVDGSKVVPPAASLAAALADVAVFRNGVLVGSCPGATSAAPDPCVSDARISGGDLQVTILTSRASTWNIGQKLPTPTPTPTPAPVPTVTDPVRAVTGYWIAAADGSVMSYGGAPRFSGSMGGQALSKPIVGLKATPTGKGYWLVASDGGIFAFGDAAFYGSTGAMTLNQPIVGMASTPTGNGYWLVASDGGIFAFGDAAFQGSTGAIALNEPIVGMESTPSGRGYWLVATDGGIFTFGDANFFGSTGAMVLNQPIVGMTTSPTGRGYLLVASDGGIFTFGDAGFQGSTGDLVLNQPIIGMSSTPTGRGYWLVARDGGIFTFGDARFHGSAAGTLWTPAIGVAW